MTNSEKITQAKEIFELTKLVLKEESERASKLETKAGIIMGAVTFLAGSLSLLARSYSNEILPIKEPWHWAIIVLFVLSIIIFFLSWLRALHVIKTRDIEKIKANTKLPRDMEGSLEIFYRKHAEKFVEILERNRKRNETKREFLNFAYNCLIFGFLLFCALIILAVIGAVSQASKKDSLEATGSIQRTYPIDS